MKILTFGVLYFKLPDDFQGGFSAALRAFADYHDSVTGKPIQDIGDPRSAPEKQTAEGHEAETWEKFWATIQTSDRRVLGAAGLAEYLGEGGAIDLDLNTGVPDKANAEMDE